MASRRSEIVDFLVTSLKNIDGASSNYNASYTYTQNLFDNVYRKIKFLDEVNDFPALYLSAGTEIRDFNSLSLTVATLDVTIRAYVYGEDNSQSLADDAFAFLNCVPILTCTKCFDPRFFHKVMHFKPTCNPTGTKNESQNWRF